MVATTIMSLRLPPELHEQIRERAAEKGVSMNAWIVRALTYQYERAARGQGTKITTEVTL